MNVKEFQNPLQKEKGVLHECSGMSILKRRFNRLSKRSKASTPRNAARSLVSNLLRSRPPEFTFRCHCFGRERPKRFAIYTKNGIKVPQQRIRRDPVIVTFKGQIRTLKFLDKVEFLFYGNREEYSFNRHLLLSYLGKVGYLGLLEKTSSLYNRVVRKVYYALHYYQNIHSVFDAQIWSRFYGNKSKSRNRFLRIIGKSL